MYFKLYAITLFACLLASAPLAAQLTHTDGGTVDTKAAELLKQASDKFAKGGITFTVTMINKDSDKKETARQSADVTYKSGKYHVKLDRQELFCDSKAVWHWNKDVGEVTVNPVDDEGEDLLNPASLLANYEKNFKAKFIRQNEDGTAVLDLTPIKPKSYHKIRVVIVEKDATVKSMELCNYDGSRGLFEVSGFKSGVKVSDKEFVFDRQANPAVEVIDMR